MTEGKIEAKLKVLASELAELREKVALMEERCAIKHECDALGCDELGKEIPSVREDYARRVGYLIDSML